VRNIFAGTEPASTPVVRSPGQRAARYSSGWVQMRKFLESRPALRVLDLGPTSPGNINYLTGLGHSVYMSNLVEEAAQPEWITIHNGETEPSFDVDRFIAEQMDFSGRTFDAVFFWDTADYLPASLTAPVFQRIHQVMDPEGVLLAFFHARTSGPDTAFQRYHLTDSDSIEMQAGNEYPLQQVFQNRAIEKLFGSYNGFRFFLAKDNLREVLVFR